MKNYNNQNTWRDNFKLVHITWWSKKLANMKVIFQNKLEQRNYPKKILVLIEIKLNQILYNKKFCVGWIIRKKTYDKKIFHISNAWWYMPKYYMASNI